MLKNLKEIQKVLDYTSKDKHNFFEYEDAHIPKNLKTASKLNVRDVYTVSVFIQNLFNKTMSISSLPKQPSLNSFL